MMINTGKTRMVFSMISVALMVAVACAGVVAVAPKAAAADEPPKVTITKTSVPEFGKIHWGLGEVVIEGEVTGMAAYEKAYGSSGFIRCTEPSILAMDAPRMARGATWDSVGGEAGVVSWDYEYPQNYPAHFKLAFHPSYIYGTQYLVNGDEPIYLRVSVSCPARTETGWASAYSDPLKFYLTRDVDWHARPTNLELYELSESPMTTNKIGIFKLKLLTNDPETPTIPMGLGGMPVNVFFSWEGGTGEKAETMQVHSDGVVHFIFNVPEVAYGKAFYVRAEFDGQGGYLASHSTRVRAIAQKPGPIPPELNPYTPETKSPFDVVNIISEGHAVLPIRPHWSEPDLVALTAVQGTPIPSMNTNATNPPDLSLFSQTPGFEAPIALIALLGAAFALYLRRRQAL